MEKLKAEVLKDGDKSIRKKKKIGFFLTSAGACGLIYFWQTPSSHELSSFAHWAIGWVISTIIAFSGFPGMLCEHLRPKHLKIIDLVWVLASAVAVTLAIVQLAERDNKRMLDQLSVNVENSIRTAKIAMSKSFQEQCVERSLLNGDQCRNLRLIAVSLYNSSSVPKNAVETLCGPTINLAIPPPAFSRDLVEGCIQGLYIARAQAQILVQRGENRMFDTWFSVWPLLMVLLVGLRVTKSVAEVFWNVK
jgi:hypothetical protein